MNKQGIQELIQISHYAAANIGYIQGGGGNTSVKLNNQMMAVKASGCKLSQMGELEGYVVVDYGVIKDYFATADITSATFEKQSGEVLQASIMPQEGLKPLRPSVEAGFHSVLKKYVIHTHSVYANILCCTETGKALAGNIFEPSDYLWLPYIDPGAKLTLMISQEIQKLGFIPDFIFMENHGVIVTADDAEEAIKLHELVNNKIRDYFGLKENFPAVAVEAISENLVKSASPSVKAYFNTHPRDLELVRENVLYPDQLVYLNNSIYKKDGSPSDIYFEGEDLYFKISLKQAEVNEETLVAYLYVLQSIDDLKMKLVSMTHEQQAFILGWESEAYRKSMLK
ncbi:MAG: class II aldolase [Vallitaleaceae bacterium]|nr:class II aldolase [Vallitaleaceae bacterium]